MALGALQALADLGHDVPDDVAVIGFDDISMAAEGPPPLTTVHEPLVGMGKALVMRLLDLMTGAGGDEAEVLPTSLVRRGSA